jgi:lysophospholipase L1-like esterase
VIQQGNALIKDMCSKSKNTYFISTSSAFLDDKGVPKPELFREDGLHLNEKGYVVWTELIKKALEKVHPLSASRPSPWRGNSAVPFQ